MSEKQSPFRLSRPSRTRATFGNARNVVLAERKHPELYARIAALAEQKGMSMAAVMAQCVRYALENLEGGDRG